MSTSVSDFFFEPDFRKFVDSEKKRPQLYRRLTEPSRNAFKVYALITALICLPALFALGQAWKWRQMRANSEQATAQVLQVEEDTVSFSYTYKGKSYRGVSSISPSAAQRLRIGDELELLVDARNPETSVLKSRRDLLSTVPWLPELMALGGLFLLPWPFFMMEKRRLKELAEEGQFLAGDVQGAEVVSLPGAARAISVTFKISTEDGQFILRERRKTDRTLPTAGSTVWVLFLHQKNCRML